MTGIGNPIGLLRLLLYDFVTLNLTALSRLISSNNLPVNKGNSPSGERSSPRSDTARTTTQWCPYYSPIAIPLALFIESLWIHYAFRELNLIEGNSGY